MAGVTWRGILYRLSGRLPLRVIKGPDGAPYLERYFLFRISLPGVRPPPGGRRGNPGGPPEETAPGRTLCQAYLHRFVASDPDRGPHNHPWNWAASLVLAGGYAEERVAGLEEMGPRVRRRRVGPGRLNPISGATFHRVILGEGAEAWSIFVHGPFVREWGFLRAVCVGYSGAMKVWPARKATGAAPWWRTAPRGRDHPERVAAGGSRAAGAVLRQAQDEGAGAETSGGGRP